MASDLHNFHVADYIVFGGMLLISITIGIYHACAGGKQKSTKEFFMANQSMRSLPVALSVLASFFSASTLLGTPAEIYQYGTQYWISVFGAMCAPITGALLFGPLFFKLKVVSVFQVCLSNLWITQLILHISIIRFDLIWLSVLNVTFSNISAISWRPVLVVEEAGVPGENHRPWASKW